MSTIECITLTKEERSKLSGKMVEIGLTQGDLAKIFGISQGAIAHIMTGRTKLKYEYAKKIYHTLNPDPLNPDPSLSFLVAFESENETFIGTEKTWDSLYQEHIRNLRSIYHNQPSDQKGIIISELEKLIERYKQP